METKKTQAKKKFVSLAEARPDLAKEWNYEKNGYRFQRVPHTGK